jgi:hypothetical protein
MDFIPKVVDKMARESTEMKETSSKLDWECPERSLK